MVKVSNMVPSILPWFRSHFVVASKLDSHIHPFPHLEFDRLLPLSETKEKKI